MNDDELKKTFPYGVMVLPRAEGDFSFSGVVKGDDETTFDVWDSPFHQTAFQRDSLKPTDHGYVATDTDGRTYGLRPLTKEQEVKF
jgi:hypothetical protein